MYLHEENISWQIFLGTILSRAGFCLKLKILETACPNGLNFLTLNSRAPCCTFTFNVHEIEKKTEGGGGGRSMQEARGEATSIIQSSIKLLTPNLV